MGGLILSGCGSYNQVNQGYQGATSPAESGQHGSNADQAPPYGSSQTEKAEDTIKPIETQYTNGNTDPTMEMSGNMAAQGNYSSAAKQRQDKKTDGFLIHPPKR